MTKFTDVEKQFVRDNWDRLSIKEIAAELGHPYDITKLNANRMGLFRKRPCSMVKDIGADEEYMKKCREEYHPKEPKAEYLDEQGHDSLQGLKMAVDTGCEFFITGNECMLADRHVLQKEYHIKIMTPGEFLEANKEEEQ